ncbi:MAG: hypothetical protein CVU94_07925 [Firmicutes bacterium HGW-Firmicutes-19]|nr:MAG: hypothetical protein CVU94_07925 [Firmicutes bacterium HGW-Firmicutes-19]
MTNSIRVKSENEYIIEVNDAGDTISLDISDLSLPEKLTNMLQAIDKLTEDFEKETKRIESLPDSPGTNPYMTMKDEAQIELTKEYFMKTRLALDIVLGAGACQKIFGDRNFVGMFDDLMMQLDPHFKKMGIKLDEYKKRIAEKYAKHNMKVLK